MEPLDALRSYPTAPADPHIGSIAFSQRHLTCNTSINLVFLSTLSTLLCSKSCCDGPIPSPPLLSIAPKVPSRLPIQMGEEGQASSFPRSKAFIVPLSAPYNLLRSSSHHDCGILLASSLLIRSLYYLGPSHPCVFPLVSIAPRRLG